MQCIYAQKGGTQNESDRLALAGLLIKAGYVVTLSKTVYNNKSVPCVAYSTKYDNAEKEVAGLCPPYQ